MRYYVRPELSHLEFESRDQALQYVQDVPEYNRVNCWVASDTSGIWHIYCNKGLYLDSHKIKNFPKPYRVILQEY